MTNTINLWFDFSFSMDIDNHDKEIIKSYKKEDLFEKLYETGDFWDLESKIKVFKWSKNIYTWNICGIGLINEYKLFIIENYKWFWDANVKSIDWEWWVEWYWAEDRDDWDTIVKSSDGFYDKDDWGKMEWKYQNQVNELNKRTEKKLFWNDWFKQFLINKIIENYWNHI